MFTGIIQQVGHIQEIQKQKNLLRYAVIFSHEGLQRGASVSIDGVCQTAVQIDSAVWFEAVLETCRCTTLGFLKKGDPVNIERSATFGQEIGGHLVSGHVYTTVKLSKIEGNVYTFSSPSTEYLFNKGFVALNGASLTVCDVTKDSFKVHFIPETLSHTTFGIKKVGDLINIEFDAMTIATVETVKRINPNAL